MEGEADRRKKEAEDDESPGGRSDGLDDYRDEIKERYPDSGDDGQDKARPGSGEVSTHEEESAPGTKVAGDATETEQQSPEQASPSSETKEKPEADAQTRSEVAEYGGRAAERPEPNAEQSDLERFRDDVREKYPQEEASKGDGAQEAERSSQSENANGSSSSKVGEGEEKSERKNDVADASAVKDTPQDSGKDGVAEEDGKPPSERENDPREAVASRSGEAGTEVRESAEGLKTGDEVQDTAGPKEDRTAADVVASEVSGRGGKIDSSQIDSENGVRVESSGKEADSHARQDADAERISQPIREDTRKGDDNASMPRASGEVAEKVRPQDVTGERPEASSGIDGVSQVAEARNRNAKVDLVDQGGNDVGGPRLRDSASAESMPSAKEEVSGRLAALDPPNREVGLEAAEHRPTKNQPQTEATMETSREKSLSSDRSQTEGASAGKGSDEHQTDSRETIKSLAVDKGLDSSSATEGKGLENHSEKAIKTAAEPSAVESQAVGEKSQTALPKEASSRDDQPDPKSGKKELADLEKIGTSGKEQEHTERKGSSARSDPGVFYTESSRQEKLDRADAIPVNANLRQSNPVVIRFDIPRQAVEEKTGVKMEEGKLYQIKGTVVGKHDFEMHRTVDSYLRYAVPVEHHHQIQTGKVYDIRITSMKEVPLTKVQSELVSDWRDRGVPWNRIVYRINHMKPEPTEGPTQSGQESGAGEKKKLHQLEKFERVENIGATFTAMSRLHKGDLVSPRDRFYFRIDNAEYKQKTGVAIDEGATYKISGEIEGVGQFQKKLRSVAAGQDMPIYVPHELKSKVELGKEYKITINTVERIPSVRDSWEKLERISMEWTWKEIASWIDTEGRINSEDGYYADIAQKDKRVIQEICGFYEEHGLHPNMILQKSVGCYHAHLHRVDDVATVIKNIEPYIRTENKKEQIEQFKQSLKAPRKTLHSTIRDARRSLNLE